MLDFSRLMMFLMSFALGLMGVSSVANAHLNATTYVPENGAVLEAAPKAINLYFGEEMRLINVSLQLDEQPKIYFELHQFKDFNRVYSLHNTQVGDGLYTLQWRGLADDGHILTDAFTFTVK